MIEIKKCPFCGSDDASLEQRLNRFGNVMVFVKCAMCGAQGKIVDGRREIPSEHEWETDACYTAVRAWNMRAN